MRLAGLIGLVRLVRLVVSMVDQVVILTDHAEWLRHVSDRTHIFLRHIAKAMKRHQFPHVKWLFRADAGDDFLNLRVAQSAPGIESLRLITTAKDGLQLRARGSQIYLGQGH